MDDMLELTDDCISPMPPDISDCMLFALDDTSDCILLVAVFVSLCIVLVALLMSDAPRSNPDATSPGKALPVDEY